MGPLFDLFIKDLFLFIERTNICNFSDDNNKYSCQNDLEELRYNIGGPKVALLRWFKENSVRANQKKLNL